MPVAPSGGPPDRDPPVLVEMRPPNNSVNFSGDRVEFVFNEHVDEASFLQSLEITPEPSVSPDLSWDGKRVRIRFREPLETNTTYILTIGTRLRDLRNVTLKAPITRAFSTGPEINEGKVSGRILEPLEGTGVAGMQVFAYALTDTTATGALPERPLYRTETDESGRFEFSYLSRRPYFVVGVRDRNSNRRPDNMELLAAPPELQLNADTAAARSASVWYAAIWDTVRPDVRRTAVLSSSRLSLRYSEDVRLDLRSAEEWQIVDSTGAAFGRASSVYQPAGDPRTVVVATAPLPRGRYRLLTGAVADSAGNRSFTVPIEFESDGKTDTAVVRLDSFTPSTDQEIIQLLPHRRAGFKLTVPADTSSFLARVSVIDTAGLPLDFTVETVNLVDYDVEVTNLPASGHFDLQWESRLSVDEDPDNAATKSQRYRQLTPRDVGSIVGFVTGFADSSRVVVEAIAKGQIYAEAVSVVGDDRRYGLQQLRPGSYLLRIFRDDDSGGNWSPGSVSPYRPAEPIFWTSDSLRVRARWETETDTIDVEGFNTRAQ